MAVPTSELLQHVGAVANAYITKDEGRFRANIPAGVEHQFSGALGDYALRRMRGAEIDLRIKREDTQDLHYVLSGAGAIRDPEKHNSTVDRSGEMVKVMINDIWLAKAELPQTQTLLEVVA
ncbi:MAG TPA: hypothetical protein VMR77_02085 [Patescibacteria group bacterium]|nr:hypothetical protein [Patescibacteria group bacterium]